MGLQTNYHDVGTGSPVVLIHGSGPGVSAWANWRLSIPELARHSRVIAYDVAGFGFTELDPSANYTMDYWLTHLVSFLDAMGLKKVSFVGNSFGGTLAAHFAARYPERTSRLAMMGANILAHPITPALDNLGWGYEPSVEIMRELLNTFPYNKALITEALVENRYNASTRPDYHKAFRAMFPAPRQNVVNAMALSEELLGSIQCETLLIHGREDAFVPLEVSFRAQAIVPRAQLHVFGQCGHWVQIERAREFCALLETFLTGEE
ncbi:alpha/beta fold hydrolase [Sphingomonas sp. LaA6.9]|uniref:alpha/beta fold hydrolase n=1 Tax=Sphingomonas sp. LaA6.9 TaxID=2919914 RepID=UPI00247A88B4|nr:alpha/beta hydrolase [Sphingomonas sp. LaA6.9]